MSDILERVRAANPVAAAGGTDRDLFRDIVSSPGDARIGSRRRRRWVVAAVAIALVAVGAGAGWAAVNQDPVSLFRSNPQADGSDPSSLWGEQQVIPSSVRDVSGVAVPGVGRVQFWYGRTRQGGWCGALRMPDGGWLGTPGVGAGGVVPGCFPTREQQNQQDQVYVINGFDYAEDDIDLRGSGGGFWRITFGRVTGVGPAARVVDLASGTSAAAVDGSLFVIALRDPDPSSQLRVHFAAYDSAGRLVADERRSLAELRGN